MAWERAGFLSRLRRSLSGKFVILVCFLAVGIAAVIGVLNYYRLVQITVELDRAALSAQSGLVAPHFRDAIERMRGDAISVSRMPPFQGIVRSISNGGVDPVDGSTTQQWRQRLHDTFKPIMAHRPSYIQMRYIGVADSGRELVRVDRVEGSLAEVPTDWLQQKASRPYFQMALPLKREETLFSPLSLNVEFGMVEPDLKVLRVVAPVRDAQDRLFGMIVINADAEQFLRAALGRVSTVHDVYVVTDTGDWIMRAGNGEISPLHFRDAWTDSAPGIVRWVMSSDGNVTSGTAKIGGEDYFIQIAEVPFSSASDGRFLRMALAVPNAAARPEVEATRRDVILMTLSIAVVVAAMAILIVQQISTPYRNLVAAIKGYRVGQPELSLPLDRQDGIGEIARSFRDIVDSIETVRAREVRMLEKLEKSNRDLEDFAHIASHDLKEPIRGVATHVSFLAEDHGEAIGEDGRRRIERIQNLCSRANQLTSELLSYARLGRAELAVKTVDMNVLLREITEDIDVFLAEQNATVTLPEPLPATTCDRGGVASIFRNLIVNAVKYNDSAEKIVEVGFLAEKTRQGETVEHDVFFVRDNGIGIENEFGSAVFRMFKRLNSEKTYGPGTGAGLAFVQKIVERHGGSIWYESVPGEGTTFFFTLKGNL